MGFNRSHTIADNLTSSNALTQSKMMRLNYGNTGYLARTATFLETPMKKRINMGGVGAMT